jgi:hypothetical protein
MQCSYTGNFEVEYRETKKHRLIVSSLDKALKSIIDDKISCETYQESQAVRLMNIGNFKIILNALI